MTFIFLHNLVDPSDERGRTYKQVNAEQQHNIPIGALVEDSPSGIRLFVVDHTRDCDMTPLYSLSAIHPQDETEYDKKFKRLHGYADYHLTIIKADGYYQED